MLTLFEWLQIAEILVMGVAALLVFSMRSGISGGQWVARIVKCENRLDSGGQKISDLSDLVQALPDRLRLEFVTKELATERFEQSLLARQRLDARLDALEAVVHHAKTDHQ